MDEDYGLPEDIARELSEGATDNDINQLIDKHDELEYEQSEEYILDLMENGYDIKEETAGDQPIYFLDGSKQSKIGWKKENGVYRIGVVSDTHLGSKAEQLNRLKSFYEEVKKNDIDNVLHAGDISDGCSIYRGHKQEKVPEAIGWGRLVDYVAEKYPEDDSIDTFFLEGNHDHKMYKKTGLRLGEQVDSKRNDLHYIGDSYARIELDEDVDVDLVHPSGGVPYTMSYRAQTWLRNKDDSDKADVTIFGHLHQFMNAHVEGSEVLYAGAFQGSTTYLERKGHVKPNAGGWIVEFAVEDGEIEKWITNKIQYPLENKSVFSVANLEEMKKED